MLGRRICSWLAAGYALMRGVHIRADFLYPQLEAQDAGHRRCHALSRCSTFPAMLFFFWTAARFLDGRPAFVRPWMKGPCDTTWAPILWPARLAMPIGAFLLLLQGISELFRAFHQMGKERERIVPDGSCRSISSRSRWCSHRHSFPTACRFGDLVGHSSLPLAASSTCRNRPSA